MTRAVSIRSRKRSILKPDWLITVARRRDVVILDTSAGWNLTGPNSNQEREPLTSTPRNMTATRSTSVMRYSGKDALSHNRAGHTNRISAASPSAVRIQTNCFPQRKPKSKIDEGPSEWMEA